MKHGSTVALAVLFVMSLTCSAAGAAAQAPTSGSSTTQQAAPGGVSLCC